MKQRKIMFKNTLHTALQFLPWIGLTVFAGWYAQPDKKEEKEKQDGNDDHSTRNQNDDWSQQQSKMGSTSRQTPNIKDLKSLERFLTDSDQKAHAAKDQG
jgi:hypothetical protein